MKAPQLTVSNVLKVLIDVANLCDWLVPLRSQTEYSAILLLFKKILCLTSDEVI